ncbi:uncharacterized protein LOC123536571 [Mercenaria mercenaria]|uniref:uncharacterized protein LOC123536571 n=1 Tax=Mercenaria mercenaria TaxID=6596 RepID=UPI00234F97C4|nr:uncharacterized protein LOC123536571 [Mercenaria mercenaria]
MKRSLIIIGIIYRICEVASVYHRHHKSSGGNVDSVVPAPMIQIESDDKDVIDLDDTTFDIALEHYQQSIDKNGEDMREVRIDGEDAGEVGNKFNVQINEGDHVTPIAISSEIKFSGGSISSTLNATDDEDMTSGSGSGDFMIEDATGKFINASEESSEDTSSEAPRVILPPYCDEPINVTWAPWSPWIQSGDHDIRFRRCHDENKVRVNENRCQGDYFERRQCSEKEADVCRMTDGSVTERFHVRCHGLDLDDVDNSDVLRDPYDRKEDCQYTLYDIKYRMAIGIPLTTDELQHADRKLWCLAEDKFIPFYTPKQRCLDNLKSFCKMTESCKYEKPTEEERSKPFSKQTCWKDFVLGGVLPAGIPVFKSQQMICQHFDKESKFGEVFGHKSTHFATLYDTQRRLPLVSMVTVRSLGDEKWPNVPFMIERGLVEETTSSVVSWFFRNKKKGIVNPAEMTSQCNIPTCQFGRKQALPSDFDYSGYKMMPLLPPDLIGWDLGQKVSTFSMTNVVPLEPTVYSVWKRNLQMVRKFAIETCKIPVELPYQDYKQHRRDGHDLPELYLLSGTVAPLNHMEVIGNDVIVPEIVWMAACCAHGADVSSFGIYSYNQYGQIPAIVSIENLHVLLQSMYYDNVDKIKIDLFPAFDSLCSYPGNDISFDLVIT